MTTTWIMTLEHIAAAYAGVNLAWAFVRNLWLDHPKDWPRWTAVGIGWVVWCLLVGLEHVWCNEFSNEDREAVFGWAVIAAPILAIFGFIVAWKGGPAWIFGSMLGVASVLAAFALSAICVWAWRVFCGVVSKAEAVAIMRSVGADDELAGGLTEVE